MHGYCVDDHPAVGVNVYDGEAYANWLSEETGHDYVLPNEAQYEYAARAGTICSATFGSGQRIV